MKELLEKIGFELSGEELFKSFVFHFQVEEPRDEGILYGLYLWYNPNLELFTVEFSNENGQYCVHPLLHIKTIDDVKSYWKLTTGQIIN